MHDPGFIAVFWNFLMQGLLFNFVFGVVAIALTGGVCYCIVQTGRWMANALENDGGSVYQWALTRVGVAVVFLPFVGAGAGAFVAMIGVPFRMLSLLFSPWDGHISCFDVFIPLHWMWDVPGWVVGYGTAGALSFPPTGLVICVLTFAVLAYLYPMNQGRHDSLEHGRHVALASVMAVFLFMTGVAVLFSYSLVTEAVLEFNASEHRTCEEGSWWMEYDCESYLLSSRTLIAGHGVEEQRFTDESTNRSFVLLPLETTSSVDDGACYAVLDLTLGLFIDEPMGSTYTFDFGEDSTAVLLEGQGIEVSGASGTNGHLRIEEWDLGDGRMLYNMSGSYASIEVMPAEESSPINRFRLWTAPGVITEESVKTGLHEVRDESKEFGRCGQYDVSTVEGSLRWNSVLLLLSGHLCLGGLIHRAFVDHRHEPREDRAFRFRTFVLVQGLMLLFGVVLSLAASDSIDSITTLTMYGIHSTVRVVVPVIVRIVLVIFGVILAAAFLVGLYKATPAIIDAYDQVQSENEKREAQEREQQRLASEFDALTRTGLYR
jgi:hypothetical protein